MSILEIKNLTKSFGNAKILKGINFSMEKGEVLSVIGSSGNGKTTLLRCINFLEKPDGGKIICDGDVIFDGSLSEKISANEIRKNQLKFGFVFQSFNLFPQYNVIENITLAPKLLAKERPD
ncbi:MAG: amino acid ABC transporter ATP-binding protein, partial [Clostridia bacterium]|nr:amino acid ABC transporter ATP-binding protein [Clostridia bacterium]